MEHVFSLTSRRLSILFTVSNIHGSKWSGHFGSTEPAFASEKSMVAIESLCMYQTSPLEAKNARRESTVVRHEECIKTFCDARLASRIQIRVICLNGTWSASAY
jgi:hypothetical protein